MDATNQDCEQACRNLLARFFAGHPNAALQKRALKALRFLAACDKPLAGKPAGWAAGAIYAVANRGRRACGVRSRRPGGGFRQSHRIRHGRHEHRCQPL